MPHMAITLLQHFLLGMGVALFLAVGLNSDLWYAFGLFDLESLTSYFYGNQALLVWLTIGLLISVVYLAVTSKPLTGLGALRLVVYAGFFIVLFNYLLDLSSGSYGLFGRKGCIIPSSAWPWDFDGSLG